MILHSDWLVSDNTMTSSRHSVVTYVLSSLRSCPTVPKIEATFPFLVTSEISSSSSLFRLTHFLLRLHKSDIVV